MGYERLAALRERAFATPLSATPPAKQSGVPVEASPRPRQRVLEPSRTLHATSR
jgi:hypothetical protein